MQGKKYRVNNTIPRLATLVTHSAICRLIDGTESIRYLTTTREGMLLDVLTGLRWRADGKCCRSIDGGAYGLILEGIKPTVATKEDLKRRIMSAG